METDRIYVGYSEMASGFGTFLLVYGRSIPFFDCRSISVNGISATLAQRAEYGEAWYVTGINLKSPVTLAVITADGDALSKTVERPSDLNYQYQGGGLVGYGTVLY